MLVSEKTLRAAIRNCMVKKDKRPLNEIVGLLNFLEKWLGPIVNEYLEAQAEAAEKAEKQATKIAKQEFSSAGVKPEKGTLNDKSNKGFEKTYNILMKILKRLAVEVESNLEKASQVSEWQPKDDSKESREEWLNSDDGKNSLSLFDAAGSLSAMVDLATDFGMDLNDISSKFKNQDNPTPLESAEWIKSALAALSDKSGGEAGVGDQVAVVDSIISNINSEAKDTAKENPEEFEEAKKEAETEAENKDKNDEEVSDEDKKNIKELADAFQIGDKPEDLESQYVKAIEMSIKFGFVKEEDKDSILSQAKDGFNKYVETKGEEGLDLISNLGTEVLKDEKFAIRAKAKQSLNNIIASGGAGSGDGGGSGDIEGKETVLNFRKYIKAKVKTKEIKPEEHSDELNNQLKASDKPIFSRGKVEGEIVGFEPNGEDSLWVKINQAGKVTKQDITTMDANNFILKEIRKYVRALLIKEYFSRK